MNCPHCHRPYAARSKVPLDQAVRRIKKLVSETMGVSVSEIEARDRYADIALARQTAMALACDFFPDLTWARIGRPFDRHSGTIIHAEEVIKKRFKTDPDFRELYVAMVAQLEAELKPAQLAA